jgi:hypothetical protein
LPCGFKKKPLLRIHVLCFAITDSKKVGVERVTAIKKAPPSEEPLLLVMLAIKPNLIDIPTTGRNLRHRGTRVEQ